MDTNLEEFSKFHEFVKDYNPYYIVTSPRSKISRARKQVSFEVAKSMMERNYNISILANPNSPIIILDIDYVDKIGQYKETLKCISGSQRGFHLFYITEDQKCKENYNGPAGEFQAHNKYVLCPGSYVPNKINEGKYFISNFHPPATITFDELPEAFQKPVEEIVTQTTQKNLSPLNGLKIEDVFGVSNGKIESPFHDSVSKNNTTISNGVIHCWRHDVFHTPISALAVLSGQIECEDGYKHNGDGQLRKTINMDQLFVWSIINNYIKEE